MNSRRVGALLQDLAHAIEASEGVAEGRLRLRKMAVMAEICRATVLDQKVHQDIYDLANLMRLGPRRRKYPHIYFVVSDRHDMIKIGWTSSSTEKRIRTLQTGSPSRLTVVFTILGPQTLEASLHQRFAPLRERGEWFNLDADLARLIGCVSGTYAGLLACEFLGLVCAI